MCVYIGLDVVESIFLAFSVGGIAFSLSAVGFLGVTGLNELGAVFGNSTLLITAFRHSEIIWDAWGWIGCHYSSKWCICPAGLALPAPSQGWGREKGNTLSSPRTWPPTCLPLWWRKTWNPHTDLSISLLLSMGEEMPSCLKEMLLLCKGETLLPATHPVEWIIVHIQASKKKKWGLSHLTARSCLPEQDKILVPVFQLPLSSSEPLTCFGHILMLMFPLPCMNCLRIASLPMSPRGIQDLTVTLLFCAENCQGLSTQRVSHGTKERNSSFALLRHSAGGREWDFSKEGIAQLEITAFKVVTFLCMDKLT